MRWQFGLAIRHPGWVAAISSVPRRRLRREDHGAGDLAHRLVVAAGEADGVGGLLRSGAQGLDAVVGGAGQPAVEQHPVLAQCMTAAAPRQQVLAEGVIGDPAGALSP